MAKSKKAKSTSKKSSSAKPKAKKAAVEASPKGIAPQRIDQQLTVHAQYIKDFSFENPNAPQSLMKREKSPEIAVEINVSATPLNDERVFESVLGIKATATEGDEKYFIAELSYATIISASSAVADDDLQSLVISEGARMGFPFARSIMSEVTQAGGWAPLNLQPIDFAQLYQRSLAARAEQGQDQVKVEEPKSGEGQNSGQNSSLSGLIQD